MNIDTSSNAPFPTSTSMGSAGESPLGSPMGGAAASSGMRSSGLESEGTVRRMAVKAHETVDKLEQTLDSGSQRVLGFQQEYGDRAREQVRTHPLASVGIAFGVGIVFAKLLMR